MRLHEIFDEDFSWRDVAEMRFLFHGILVAVNDFNITRAAVIPLKTDAPLVVYPNAVLARTSSLTGVSAPI